jgi:hypothetical protein
MSAFVLESGKAAAGLRAGRSAMHGSAGSTATARHCCRRIRHMSIETPTSIEASHPDEKNMAR